MFFSIFHAVVSNLDHLASKVLNQDRIVVCSLSIDVNTICCIISHNLPLVVFWPLAGAFGQAQFSKSPSF